MEIPSQNNNQHKHFSPISFVAGLLIAFGLFFLIYKLTPHTPTENKITPAGTDTAPVNPIISISPEGTFDFSGEHFAREHHHRHIDQDAEAIVVSPKETDLLEKGNLSAEQKKLLELLPNAPVIYIFNLKITDYQDLYFDMGEPLLLSNKLLAGQILHDALKDFSEKKFAGCQQKMTLLLKENSADVNALFYSGMSAYYQKNYGAANKFFQKVMLMKNNTFRQEAKWFIAMALLNSGKQQEAKKLFEEIKDVRGFYADRAAAQLESR